MPYHLPTEKQLLRKKPCQTSRVRWSDGQGIRKVGGPPSPSSPFPTLLFISLQLDLLVISHDIRDIFKDGFRRLPFDRQGRNLGDAREGAVSPHLLIISLQLVLLVISHDNVTFRDRFIRLPSDRQARNLGGGGRAREGTVAPQIPTR